MAHLTNKKHHILPDNSRKARTVVAFRMSSPLRLAAKATGAVRSRYRYRLSHHSRAGGHPL